MGQFKSALVQEAKASAPAPAAGGKFKVKLISAGWGSSGYYSQEMLAENVGGAFPAGTHVYFDHPSEAERWDRPERSVKDLVGTLVEDPVMEGDTAWSVFQPFPSYAPVIEQMKDNVGMSIRVKDAAMEWGEVEGVEGPIIKSLVPNRMNSVDIVTHAGRGGAIVSAMESARLSEVDKPYLHSLGFQLPSGTKAAPVSEALPESPKESHMAELTEAQVKTLSTLADAAPALVAEMNAQREAREAAAVAAAKAKEIDPLDTALALTEAISSSDLSKRGRQEALADIKRGMDVAEAITRWTGSFPDAPTESAVDKLGFERPAAPAAGIASLNESILRLADRSKGVQA